jgi:hypothetical protein
LLLDDDRIVGTRDADAIRDPQDVTIDGEARDAERMAQHDVRSLATDAGQCDQVLHGPRNLAIVLFDDGRRHPDEGP